MKFISFDRILTRQCFIYSRKQRINTIWCLRHSCENNAEFPTSPLIASVADPLLTTRYYTSLTGQSISSSNNDFSRQLKQLLGTLFSDKLESGDDWSSVLSQLSDAEILQLLAEVHKRYAPNEVLIQKLLVDIDQECVRRAASWDFSTFMNFLRQYPNFGASQNSSFMLYAMNKRFLQVLDAPLTTKLDYLHALNEAKVWFKFKNSKFKLQDLFHQHFHELNWNQINVFVESMVVQNCVVVDDTLKKNICRKMIDDFDEINNEVMKKLFRLFVAQTLYPKNFLFITPWMLHVLDAFNDRIGKFDAECMNCVGLLCIKMFIYNGHLLQHISDNLLLRLKNIEASELATSLSILTYFNFHSKTKDFYCEVLRKMDEQEIFQKLISKPRLLMRILSSLALVGVYSYEYLDVAFSDQFLRKLLGKKINRFRVTPEILLLHGSVAVECPDYKGSILNDEIFKISLKKRIEMLPKVLRKHERIENVRSKSMISCLNAPRDISTFNRALYCSRGLLDELLGGVEYSHICYLLPQFKRASIIFCTNTDGDPVKIPDKIRCSWIIGRKHIDAHFIWYAITFMSHNIYTNTEPMLMGEEIAKDRQLRLCGFKIISITQHGWLNASIEEKLNILQHKMVEQSGIKLRVAKNRRIQNE